MTLEIDIVFLARYNINNARGTVDLGATIGTWLCFYKIPIK